MFIEKVVWSLHVSWEVIDVVYHVLCGAKEVVTNIERYVKIINLQTEKYVRFTDDIQPRYFTVVFITDIM